MQRLFQLTCEIISSFVFRQTVGQSVIRDRIYMPKKVRYKHKQEVITKYNILIDFLQTKTVLSFWKDFL